MRQPFSAVLSLCLAFVLQSPVLADSDTSNPSPKPLHSGNNPGYRGRDILFDELVIKGAPTTRLMQTAPIVLDHRNSTSGSAEPHQKTSPLLPAGAANEKASSLENKQIEDSKLDKELIESLAACKSVQNDEPKLKIRLEVIEGTRLVSQLKAMGVKLIDSRTGVYIVEAPVRRISEIARLNAVMKIRLVK